MPFEIYQDNQSIIALIRSKQTFQWTKLIEVRFHYTRDKIADRTIQLEYCSTNKMIADNLSKALAEELLAQV